MNEETAVPLLTADFDYLRRMVQDHSSVVLDDGKEYLAESRLLPILRDRKLKSLGQLVDQLRRDPPNGLHREVVEAMLTTETSFFRDVKPFETLRDFVLPDIISKRSASRTLNIWCAACSSGQEVYSLMMVINEFFSQLEGWNLRVVASDISGRMLERARQGIYSQMEVNRGLPAAFLVKYFEKSGSDWAVCGNLKRRVEFMSLNLTKPWPYLPPMDLIFMRNVMIYFDVETKKKVLEQAAQLLNPQGYLFLGGAETTLNLVDRFERVPWEQASCFRPIAK